MKKSFFNKNNPWKLCFINEENKSKEIQGKNVLSFTKFALGGFCPGVLSWGFCLGVLSGGICPGGFCPGVFCPDTESSKLQRSVALVVTITLLQCTLFYKKLSYKKLVLNFLPNSNREEKKN